MSAVEPGPGVPTRLSDGAQRAETLVPHNHLMVGLLGQRDELLRLVEQSFPDTTIWVQGNLITVEGPEAARVARLFDELVLVLETGQSLDAAKVARTVDMVREDLRPSEVLTAEVVRGPRGRTVRPHSAGQKSYVDAIASSTITFGIGPAGTGKSYLAVALAVQALQSHQVNRIILTRPAVEAGERLGFLPGDLMAKVDPYLRPLYDALYDMLEPEGMQRLIDRGSIEVAPLAFMRGRTLNSSFIILDEAQNTTPEQMKMFLTRIGFGSKCVVTGDVTQIDVAGGRSGLVGLERVLGGVEGIAFVHLTRRDVVRHRIVADIIHAYERAEAAPAGGSAPAEGSALAEGAPAGRSAPAGGAGPVAGATPAGGLAPAEAAPAEGSALAEAAPAGGAAPAGAGVALPEADRAGDRDA
ncbi:MAG TPA: PhoH family protein [Acidimicrobiales bacterium]|nr:PhoH family protein [Acidimicrobiales bacterium]